MPRERKPSNIHDVHPFSRSAIGPNAIIGEERPPSRSYYVATRLTLSHQVIGQRVMSRLRSRNRVIGVLGRRFASGLRLASNRVICRRRCLAAWQFWSHPLALIGLVHPPDLATRTNRRPLDAARANMNLADRILPRLLSSQRRLGRDGRRWCSVLLVGVQSLCGAAMIRKT